VSLHRRLFRKGAKAEIVSVAHGFLQASLVGIALTLSGVSLLIFDVVWTRTAGVVAAIATFVVILLAWVVIPAAARRRRD
jgi:preprotein translocase subunit SecD